MFFHKILFSLAILAPYVLAGVITISQQIADEVAGCRDLTTPRIPFPNPACWDILNMTTWMTDWNATTTTCTTLQDLLTPCQCFDGEPWVTCFMRLTFASSPSAGYQCTNLTLPNDCSEPNPRTIVAGPAEIFYGSFSIWCKFLYISFDEMAVLILRFPALTQYMSNWAAALNSTYAVPTISSLLANPKNINMTATQLLSSLIIDYGSDQPLDNALLTLFENSDLQGSSETIPTEANAQDWIADILQDVMNIATSDFLSGYFLTMASKGMLLNNTSETTLGLETKLKNLTIARTG